LPKYLTFFPLKYSKLFFDSALDAKHKSKVLKIFFANVEKKSHLLKVFLVILPLIKTKGTFFFLISNKKFGQISESTKIANFGFQLSKKFLTNFKESIGKNLWCKFFIFLFFFLKNIFFFFIYQLLFFF